MRVETASSAWEGLRAIALEEPAAVVSDLNMPGMDGISFLARVGELNPGILRVLYTGAFDVDLKRVAWERCGAAVFWKDADPQALVHWIRRHLESHDPPIP